MDITTYTVGEAAKALGVIPNTVRSWISRGELKGRRAGGRWLITKQDLETFREKWQARPAVQQQLKNREASSLT